MDKKQRQMAADNLHLVKQALHSVNSNESVVGMERDDLYQTGCLALCEAVLAFSGQGSFPAYAYTVIRNRLLDVCRKAVREKQRRIYPDTEWFWESPVLTARMAKERLREVETRCLLASLCQRHKGTSRKGIQILSRQAAGYSVREAAGAEGIRPATAYNWKRRAQDVLKQEFRRTADSQ